MCLYAFLSFIFFLRNGASYLFLFWIFIQYMDDKYFIPLYLFSVILQSACVTMHLKYLNRFSVVERNNPPLFHKGIKLSFYFYLSLSYSFYYLRIHLGQHF